MPGNAARFADDDRRRNRSGDRTDCGVDSQRLAGAWNLGLQQTAAESLGSGMPAVCGRMVAAIAGRHCDGRLPALLVFPREKTEVPVRLRQKQQAAPIWSACCFKHGIY